jgi:pyridoxal phosphate enzyme (YggS family)
MSGGHLAAVRARISAAAHRAGRDAQGVRLVAVSKGRTAAEVAALVAAGQLDFGENRAQELVAKAPAAPPEVRWHFVGRLQRNKVNKVRPRVTLLHSLDREGLAPAWGADPEAPPALLQVNVAGESQKQGVAPDDAERVLASAVAAGVDVRGLMTIAPLVEDPESVRWVFDAQRDLRDRIAVNWPSVVELSMGMTDDFEVAIEEGASIVRVGRAIFGHSEQG